MKLAGALFLTVCLLPCASRADELNIATLTCGKYQNVILNPGDSAPKVDSIDIVMWLFGFAVAKSGAHVMYGDALPSFGFALDIECKDNPSESLLEAVPHIKLNSANPMDMTTLDCSTFESRHQASTKSDPDSATTIMMWLYGYAVGRSGSHMLDTTAVNDFGAALLAQCAKNPQGSLYDALSAVKTSKPWK